MVKVHHFRIIVKRIYRPPLKGTGKKRLGNGAKNRKKKAKSATKEKIYLKKR